MNPKHFMNTALAFVKSAEFATGAAIGMVPITMVLSGECRLKADDILAEEEMRRYDDGNDAPLTTGEKAKLTWHCYILPVLAGGLTVFFFLYSHKKQGEKLLALATAYSLTDTAYKEYRSKVEQLYGKKKEEQVMHEIHQDKTKEMSMLDDDILAQNHGEVLCVDGYTGIKFWSSAQKIKDAVGDTNAEMIGDMYVPLAYLYERLDIPQIKMAQEIGWNVLADKQIRLELDTTLDKEEIPTLVMDLYPRPRPLYDNL